MRYIVKQKIFALGDNFTIRNEHGEECYRVKRKGLFFGRQTAHLRYAGE